MEGNIMNKPIVFISYSHKDEKWKKLLHPFLEVLVKQDRIIIWDDRNIDAGGKWFNKIKQVMDKAAVAVCLISADYLVSDFCTKEEIPYLLERRKKHGMVLIPLMLRPCPWEIVPWLKEIQIIPRDGKSISKDFKDEPGEIFNEVALYIFSIIDNPNFKPPQPTSLGSPPEKIDIHRLPMTGEELFGRQEKMKMLENAWESDDAHIVSLVAWAGVGKTTLVNKWLEQMKAKNYLGANRIFAWSFYSQGTGDKVTSADVFISEALTWFGDPDPSAGSPWDKGARLSDLILKNKTLLILDGLEPLQSVYDYECGKIKDPALSTLISELARQNSGLCIITTRKAVVDLTSFQNTCLQVDLELISNEAGRSLLRVSGVQGTDFELEAATQDFGNHTLAISLLGVYLHKIPGHNISHAAKIPDLDIPLKEGRHPRRIIAAFERCFGEGPEVELLRMLGLFDHPADAGAITALKADPAIPNLTKYIQKLSEAGWLRLIHKLRKTKLIASESCHQPNQLDAHPLVRDHFSQQLRDAYPGAWREGNNRLYEHLIKITKEYPDTIEEISPLYAALVHGCRAGRYQEALDDVYKIRIQRKDEFFNIKKLGAFSADLVAISQFFDSFWDKPKVELTESAKAYILTEVGFDLRALGRLKESAKPMQAGLEGWIMLKSWKDAAITAGNLSGLYLTIGDIVQSIEYAKQSVNLADCSSDAYQQVSKRTTLADALHQAGCKYEAELLFCEAEMMQKKDNLKYPLLNSLPGFRYCDLLLNQGKYQDVLTRTQKLFDLHLTSYPLLSIALDCLSLGRAHLLQVLKEDSQDFTQVVYYLNKAVNGLREAGTQHEVPRGLVARAELYRVQGEFVRAQYDIEEAMTISERGEMGLHQVDCHLEYARLYLAMGKIKDSRKCLDIAKEMINKMEYHRRDKDLKEIDEQLEKSAK